MTGDTWADHISTALIQYLNRFRIVYSSCYEAFKMKDMCEYEYVFIVLECNGISSCRANVNHNLNE